LTVIIKSKVLQSYGRHNTARYYYQLWQQHGLQQVPEMVMAQCTKLTNGTV